MGRNFVSGDSPGQGWLMPADPREWLPPRHLAWSVLDQVAEMDLSGFGAAYRSDGQGGKAYHPAMMTALLLYCYCRGKRSSRDVEAATWDDVGARVICGNLHPDHSTCAAFVRRHAAAVAGLLPESVRACAREGLVSLEVTAGDGTKLKAAASMASNVTAGQLQEQIAELEAFIDADVEAWIAQILDAGPDAPAPARAGPGAGPDAGGPGDGARKAPKRARQTLERRRAARARLDARQAPEQGMLEARRAGLAARLEQKEAAVARYEQAAAARLEHWERKAAACAPGKRPRGRKPGGPDACPEVRRARAAAATARAGQAAGPVPAADPAAKVNTADPASRVMPLKKGGYDQLHNVQALATAGSQVILAVTRHDSPCDVGALTALLAEARRVLDAAGIAGKILKALFDAGYASDANFTADTEPELYVAVTREARQAGRSRDGRAPARLPSWDTMAARLDTPEGKELYKKRAATIEPVFAQLTSRLGRTLHYRGTLLDAELALWAASHNILKAIRARTARQARHAARAIPAAA
jgi:transposase